MTALKSAKLAIGQIIYHQTLHTRGVVYDVDYQFYGSKEWYRKIAHQKASKNQPWYHILVDNTAHRLYAPESELIASQVKTAINHPQVEQYFYHLEKGVYHPKLTQN